MPNRSSAGRRTWSRYSKDKEKLTLVPPWIVTVIGDLCSSPAKSRNGRIAWNTSKILDGESALILMFLLTISAGDRLALNVKDLLPTMHPDKSALVASA